MVESTLETPELCPISDYMMMRQSRIVEYVAWTPIYELCTGAERMEGFSRFLRWWDQYHGPNQTDREV